MPMEGMPVKYCLQEAIANRMIFPGYNYVKTTAYWQ